MNDSYFSIKTRSTVKYKDKGSKFIAHAFPVSSEKEVETALEQIKNKYYDASHHCYAYITGKGEGDIGLSDDGEPRHTAGDPILNQIRSAGLRDVLVVVVRYFGGTKLGKSGLIQAYKTSAKSVLAVSEIIEKTWSCSLKIHFKYTAMNEVMRSIQKLGLEIERQEYDQKCTIICRVPESRLSETEASLIGLPEVEFSKF